MRTIDGAERRARIARRQIAAAAELTVALDASVGEGRTWHEAGH